MMSPHNWLCAGQHGSIVHLCGSVAWPKLKEEKKKGDVKVDRGGKEGRKKGGKISDENDERKRVRCGLGLLITIKKNSWLSA